jgi:dUTP pyrophosphatase
MSQPEQYPEKYFVQKKLKVRIRAKDKELLPVYATQGAAGADIKANVSAPVTIPAHSCVLIPTGLFLEIPIGYEVQIRPRSGLALKNQVTVLNSPGTIDSDYRGELQVILMNHSNCDFVVEPGMRIAQMVIASCIQAQFELTETLSSSERGAGGFGHTGTK